MVRKRGNGESAAKRHKAVLRDDLEARFQVVLDGQKGVMDRLDRVEARVEEVHRDLKKYLTDGLEKVYEDLGKISSRLQKVEARPC
jgi:tetrahydromethanopterin S-methyltransferase subunit G